MKNQIYVKANPSINDVQSLTNYLMNGFKYALIDEVEGKIIDVSENRAYLSESYGKFIIDIASQIHSITNLQTK